MRAAVEALETRVLLTTVVVNTTIDGIFPPSTGLVSLRNAVATANSSPTPTTITFDPTVFAGAKTITLNGNRLELSNSSEATTIIGPSSGVTVSGNNLSRDFQIDGNVTVNLTGMTVTDANNSAIYNGGTVSLTHVTVSNSSGSNGGAGIYNSGNMTLSSVILSGNSASNGSAGGGLYDSGGQTLVLSNVIVSNNTAAGAGGGLYLGSGNATLTGVTLSGNSSSYGGGLFNNGTATLANVTISGNMTSSYGGAGIYNDGTLSLANITVSGNTSSGGSGSGGGIYTTGSGLTLTNSIISGNSVINGSSAPDVSGGFNSLGFNLVGITDGSTGFNSGDLTGTSAKPLNAKLGALADNGGFTQTMLPLPGSPAIDAGFNALAPAGIKTDQRGLPRIVNTTVDIGAVEVQAASSASITLTPPAAQVATAGQSKLFLLGSFAVSNVTGPFSVDVNWGDGSADTKFSAAAIGTIGAGPCLCHRRR